jgi:hypothetical protein
MNNLETHYQHNALIPYLHSHDVYPRAWQHFKGNIYRILICTGVGTTPEEWCKLPGIVNFKHSETGEQYLKVVLTTDHQIALLTVTGGLILEPHVIYQQHYPDICSISDAVNNLQVWTRPLDNFLEILSSPYIEGVASSNYPRFNRIS